MSPVDPYDFLLDIYDEEFGLRLTNFSIKPVHVANGLARGLTERTYDTTALAKTLRRYVRNQKLGVDQERNPNRTILERYPEAFEALKGAEPNPQRLTRLRALAFDVLGADGAVFDQPDQSCYTLSNERFITRDPSDVRAGLFLARLLTSEPVGRTDAADCLRDLLVSENDAWTTLALPLLTLGQARQESDGEGAARAAKADHLFGSKNGRLQLPVLRTSREAYDRLARFERQGASKLNSLRRLMLFGCFVIYVHVTSRWSEREKGAPRAPILLDLFDGTVVSVRDASRATLRAAGDAIEGLIRDRFEEHVSSTYGTSAKEIRKALPSLTQLEPGQRAQWESVARAFEQRIAGNAPPVEALAQALVDAAFSSSKNREVPIGALIELGRRAGFLAPWSNVGRGGKFHKRYAATAEFLETLVASTVEPDEPLEFPEFLDRLRDDFGVVVGRPEDDLLIRHNNLFDDQFGPTTAINEEDLRRNVALLRELVVESGYAKSYADGRTVVTTHPEGQL